jgi:hypothetical protein
MAATLLALHGLDANLELAPIRGILEEASERFRWKQRLPMRLQRTSSPRSRKRRSLLSSRLWATSDLTGFR